MSRWFHGSGIGFWCERPKWRPTHRSSGQETDALECEGESEVINSAD
ncbi:hypothetical protein RHOER0001_0916 [Rhodococcus erythropolis SK121]|nr:hypothetical protein RHOER0001_0916 [Rhodococcus erythropolis SK121]